MMPVETLAEQAAVVDLVSGGRLELGVGAGWRAEEFTRVGADHRARYATLEDQLRRLPGLWADGTVTPAPVQDPLPTWVGARGPRGARLAGRVGAGCSGSTPPCSPRTPRASTPAGGPASRAASAAW